MHTALRKNKAIVDLLYNKRGISLEAIKQFKLGHNQGRITIPIFDDVGDCVNVRRYSFQEKTINKMISYKSGYGEARLFPVENIKHSSIILCEGEMDCLLLNQLGFPAIPVTRGDNLLPRVIARSSNDVFICAIFSFVVNCSSPN